jgi:hypothetical protein
MKPSSPTRPPLSRAKARNAALMNQLATPGLGSLLARRWVAGIGQLALALAGFIMFVLWFGELMIQLYGQIDGNVPERNVNWIGEGGLMIFSAAWLWSLVTSFSLIREAKRNEIAEVMKPLVAKPPRLN